MDKQSKERVPVLYDYINNFQHINNFQNGFAKVKKDGEEYFINTKGEKVEIK